VNNAKQSCRDRGGALCGGGGSLDKSSKNDHELQESFRESMWPATPNKVIILTTHSGFMLQASSLRLYTLFGRNSFGHFFGPSPLPPNPQPTKKKGELLPKNETNLDKVIR
jgi:hypothetical protein